MSKQGDKDTGSPFHVKGVAYKGALKYYDAHVPGGFRTMLASLEDPALRAFAAQPFVPSGWYDVLPFRELDAVAARMSRVPFERFLRDCCRAQAHEEFSGIYSMFLKWIRPRAIAAVIPKIVAQYYDFGRIETHAESDREVTVTRRALPASIATWLSITAAEYANVTLELAGMKNVTYALLATEPDGERDGHALVRQETRVRWD